MYYLNSVKSAVHKVAGLITRLPSSVVLSPEQSGLFEAEPDVAQSMKTGVLGNMLLM